MTAMRRAIPFALAAALSGCYFGQTAAKFEPARGPRGVAVSITTVSRMNVFGELIEVGSESLLVNTAPAVVLVPYTAIERAAFLQTGLFIDHGQAPSPSTREKLRLLSRFPQGLSPALRQALLDARGQTEVTRITR
jgi:hypothetical protein